MNAAVSTSTVAAFRAISWANRSSVKSPSPEGGAESESPSVARRRCCRADRGAPGWRRAYRGCAGANAETSTECRSTTSAAALIIKTSNSLREGALPADDTRLLLLALRCREHANHRNADHHGALRPHGTEDAPGRHHGLAGAQRDDASQCCAARRRGCICGELTALDHPPPHPTLDRCQPHPTSNGAQPHPHPNH